MRRVLECFIALKIQRFAKILFMFDIRHNMSYFKKNIFIVTFYISLITYKPQHPLSRRLSCGGRPKGKPLPLRVTMC